MTDHQPEPTQTLDPTRARDIRDECEALSIAYARAVDFRDYDSFVELFAEDGELDTGAPLIGRESIKKALGRRPDELVLAHQYDQPTQSLHGGQRFGQQRPGEQRGNNWLQEQAHR